MFIQSTSKRELVGNCNCEHSLFICRGGLTNELYICSLPNNYPVINKEKKKVLLRIYGRLYDDLVSSSSALISDIIVFTILSERNVGPKLYAIFPEGRLEELLPVSLFKWYYSCYLEQFSINL